MPSYTGSHSLRLHASSLNYSLRHSCYGSQNTSLTDGLCKKTKALPQPFHSPMFLFSLLWLALSCPQQGVGWSGLPEHRITSGKEDEGAQRQWPTSFPVLMLCYELKAHFPSVLWNPWKLDIILCPRNGKGHAKANVDFLANRWHKQFKETLWT